METESLWNGLLTMELVSHLWWFWYFLRYAIFHWNRFADKSLTLNSMWPMLCAKPNQWCFSQSQSQVWQQFIQTKETSRVWPSACANIHDQPKFCSWRKDTRICGHFQIHFRYNMSKVRSLVPLQAENKQTSGGIWHKRTEGHRYHSTGPKVWSSLDPWESLSWKNAVDDLTDVISQGLQGHSDW